MPDEAPPSQRIDTAWFRARLDDRRMSQRELARSLGLDSGAVSLMFRGKRTMKIAEAVSIASLLGVPADDVMRHAGVQIESQFEQVPLNCWIDGAGEVHMDPDSTATVPHPGGGLPQSLGAGICRTAGTDLEHMDGWILFSAGMQTHAGIRPEAVGRLSFVRLRGGIIYLARMMHSLRRGRWDLAGPAAFVKEAEIDWATPVLTILP
jgi:transcriptional regulator with XRE-family HTH domain